MKKDDIVKIMDAVSEADFPEQEVASVPMVIKETPEVPATIQEEQKLVKENLYDTETKLRSVLDYLVNNIEDLSAATGLIKQSPVQEICSVAREILNINDKIYKYSVDNNEKSFDKTKTLNVNQTNYNFNSDNKEGFSLDDLDKHLKDGKTLKV